MKYQSFDHHRQDGSPRRRGADVDIIPVLHPHAVQAQKGAGHQGGHSLSQDLGQVGLHGHHQGMSRLPQGLQPLDNPLGRSEERRVGKECL